MEKHEKLLENVKKVLDKETPESLEKFFPTEVWVNTEEIVKTLKKEELERLRESSKLVKRDFAENMSDFTRLFLKITGYVIVPKKLPIFSAIRSIEEEYQSRK